MERPPQNRLPKRAGSGRFPIRVRTISTQSSAESEPSTSATATSAVSSASSASSSSISMPLAATPSSSQRLPAQPPPPPPPIPVRSQSRPDGHPGAGLRRPAVAPLILGSERLRSNSEGLVQDVRTKRMGIVSRKTSELGTVDEVRMSGFSHYRGLSHGSVMQGSHVSAATIGRDINGSSSPVSPSETERTANPIFSSRYNPTHRLSSLPERKSTLLPNELHKKLDGIKTVLYALGLLQQHVATIVNLIRNSSPSAKRSSLERVFYNASTHVHELDREINVADALATNSSRDLRRALSNATRACLTCVMAYEHVAVLLLATAHSATSQMDARYVRTLLLTTYNSLVEIRNASSALFGAVTHPTERVGASHLEQVVDPSATPTQAQPAPVPAPVPAPAPAAPVIGRPRNDTLFSRPVGRGVGPYGMMHTLARSNASNASSRTASLTSAVTNGLEPLSRSNTMRTTVANATAEDELPEERQFERIFIQLSHSQEIVIRILPIFRQQFARHFEVSQRDETVEELRNLWAALDANCALTVRLAEQVKGQLSSMALKEPEARSDVEFWRTCNDFVESFVELASLLREAMTHGVITREIGSIIRPVAKAFKELADIVNSSRWSHLGRRGSPQSAQTPHSGFATAAVVASQAAAAAAASTSSPYMASLPPTPLSAALGPAAQATVPLATTSATNATASTSTGASRNGLFSGNVFERADSLLSAPSRSMTLVGTPGGMGAGSGGIATTIVGTTTASASASAAANLPNVASSSHPHYNLVTPTVISPLGTRINHRAF